MALALSDKASTNPGRLNPGSCSSNGKNDKTFPDGHTFLEGLKTMSATVDDRINDPWTSQGTNEV